MEDPEKEEAEKEEADEKEVKIKEVSPEIKEVREIKELEENARKGLTESELSRELDSVALELERIRKISERSLFDAVRERDLRADQGFPLPNRAFSREERKNYTEAKKDEQKIKYSSEGKE